MGIVFPHTSFSKSSTDLHIMISALWMCFVNLYRVCKSKTKELKKFNEIYLFLL